MKVYMDQNKTQPTEEDVATFFATLEDCQRQDAEALTGIIYDITREAPVMWGKAIVGFGLQHYRYSSGREGDWMKIGFAPRKGQLSIYPTCDLTLLESELKKLGTYTTGKSCIYIKKLADVNQDALKELIAAAYERAGRYLVE